MLRKHPPALRFARTIDPGECNISVVSYLEILRGCRGRGEAKDLAELVAEWFTQVLPLTPEISAAATSLMEQFALSHRPGVDDTLIAATALSRKETLATGNVKHFKFIPGLALRRFNP
jgi:predicted nucleic acid-binding protein